MNLRPFIRYYGGKWRAAPRYPTPMHRTIVEPFAGAAGYSMRYPDHYVVLVERYAVIAEMWRYLIAVPASEVRRIPCVDAVDDLPAWVPAGGRAIVGFAMNDATTAPCKVLSAGRKTMRAAGSHLEGWTEAKRERVASQVERIRHWQIIEGDYTEAPDIKATWFVDPPYNNRAGSYYVHSALDYASLGAWCRARRGQTLVCENDGATWLPFEPFATFQRNPMSGADGGSKEVLWSNLPIPGQLPLLVAR